MGSTLSLQPLDCQEIRHHEWDQIHQKQKQSSKSRTLRNRRTGAMLDQYQLSWLSKQEYSFYIKSFNWRNRRRNQSPIVLSVSLEQVGKGDICGGKYSANIYLEHMPLRLSQIEDIPLCQSLFILSECLEGYWQLYQHSGYFKIQDRQICIDRTGKVKVWVNADLAKNYPECDSEGSSKKDEIDMVQQLLQIITKSTNAQQMPSPSLIQYFDMVRRRDIISVGFEYAKIVIFQFARVFQIRIPSRFQTILQLFAPNLTVNKRYMTNIETLPSSIEFGHQPRLQHTFSTPQLSSNTSYQPRRYEINYSQPFSHQVNPNSDKNFPYIAQTNQSHYIHQMPSSLNLQDLNINQRQGQETKRKSGNSNNSKRSGNSKSQMIIPPLNYSTGFQDGNTEDRNTMKSMPNYNAQVCRNRFDKPLQKVRHSQYLMGSIERERNFGRKSELNKDSFGMLPYRRAMKQSCSSKQFPSNSSSHSRKEQTSNEQSKNSVQSAQNRMMEQFKQIVLQEEKKQGNSPQNSSKEWELDPEIEADMRRYLGQ